MRTEAERREAARAWDAAYRDKLKERKIEEADDTYDGDPLVSIASLLLLLPNSRSGGWAREAIAVEIDRYLQPLYSANKSTIEQERFMRLQESYSLYSSGTGKKPNNHLNY
jgi:hypothetical protein